METKHAIACYNAINENREVFGLPSSDQFEMILDMDSIRSYNPKRLHFSINIPQEFGIFSTIISIAEFSGFCEVLEDGGIWAVLKLSYCHPDGGQNGSDVGRFWLDQNGELTAVALAGKTVVYFKDK